MNEDAIKELIDQYVNLHAAMDMICIEKQDALNAYFAEHPEVQEALQDIDTEFDLQIDEAMESVQNLKTKIDEAILAHGASVETYNLTVSYTNAGYSYHKASIDAYILAHPEQATALAALRSPRSAGTSYHWKK